MGDKNPKQKSRQAAQKQNDKNAAKSKAAAAKASLGSAKGAKK